MFNIILLGVWISDKTFPLFFVYFFSLFGYQKRHSFLSLINYFSMFWISDETLPLVFVYYFSVFGYRVKHSFLCLIYFFLLGGKDETFDSPEDTGEEEKHKLSRSAIKPDKIKLTVVKFAEEDPIVKWFLRFLSLLLLLALLFLWVYYR